MRISRTHRSPLYSSKHVAARLNTYRADYGGTNIACRSNHQGPDNPLVTETILLLCAAGRKARLRPLSVSIVPIQATEGLISIIGCCVSDACVAV